MDLISIHLVIYFTLNVFFWKILNITVIISLKFNLCDNLKTLSFQLNLTLFSFSIHNQTLARAASCLERLWASKHCWYCSAFFLLTWSSMACGFRSFLQVSSTSPASNASLMAITAACTVLIPELKCDFFIYYTIIFLLLVDSCK